MRGRKLRSGVFWLEALKQKGRKKNEALNKGYVYSTVGYFCSQTLAGSK